MKLSSPEQGRYCDYYYYYFCLNLKQTCNEVAGGTKTRLETRRGQTRVELIFILCRARINLAASGQIECSFLLPRSQPLAFLVASSRLAARRTQNFVCSDSICFHVAVTGPQVLMELIRNMLAKRTAQVSLGWRMDDGGNNNGSNKRVRVCYLDRRPANLGICQIGVIGHREKEYNDARRRPGLHSAPPLAQPTAVEPRSLKQQLY